MRKVLTIVVVLFLVVIVMQKVPNVPIKNNNATIAYIAIGDSYTIGQNVDTAHNYPSLVTRHLQSAGIPITLVANPSITGYTTQDAIEFELPVVDSSHPIIATVMLGTNDIVQGVSSETFAKNLSYILDYIQSRLPQKNKIVLLTIPDFSVTPFWHKYYGKDTVLVQINQFNQIIKEEAQRRSIPVVDVTGLSKEMGNDRTLQTYDGLHPSAKEYSKWEEKLFPVLYNLLTEDETKNN